jgi:hypothetical protein
MKLFSINSKMAKSGKGKLKIVNFTIPAFITKDGFKTCPQAGVCAAACYARSGFYTFTNVYGKHRKNLEATLQADFVSLADKELQRIKPNVVRIHDAGDFYNEAYLDKWINIVRLNHNIKFYAYTKMVAMVTEKRRKLKEQFPENLIIIFSLGGKQDSLINQATDRHSRVFESVKELKSAGYIDASNDDMKALTPNTKVGLVYHHPKSWENAHWKNVK